MKRGGTKTSKHEKKKHEKIKTKPEKNKKEPQKKILELSRCGRARSRTISPLKPLNEMEAKGPKDGRRRSVKNHGQGEGQRTPINKASAKLQRQPWSTREATNETKGEPQVSRVEEPLSKEQRSLGKGGDTGPLPPALVRREGTEAALSLVSFFSRDKGGAPGPGGGRREVPWSPGVPLPLPFPLAAWGDDPNLVGPVPCIIGPGD